MVLNEKQNEIKSNSPKKSQVFTIKSSPKAFEILSNKLYKDKVTAIIRELSCNAFDSRTEAKVWDKIQIHLPNRMEPWFSIRDFGIGMAPKEVHDLYTSYFSSSKTETNELIGALGLGSKSPFAYTESFTISATKAGKQYTFSCYKGEDGSPQVQQIGKFKTAEKNGVEIKFAVKENDFREFISKTEQVLIGFKTTSAFEILNAPDDFKILELEVVASTRAWTILEELPRFLSGRLSYGEHTLVRMGNILYPISHSQLTDVDTDLLKTPPMILEMPLGSLDIAPSREELNYDAATQEALKVALMTFSITAEAKIREGANKQGTPIEKLTTFLAGLRSISKLGSYNLTRRKLGGKTFYCRQFDFFVPSSENYKIYQTESSSRGTYKFQVKRTSIGNQQLTKTKTDQGSFIRTTRKMVFIVIPRGKKLATGTQIDKVRYALYEETNGLSNPYRNSDVQIIFTYTRNLPQFGNPTGTFINYEDLPKMESENASYAEKGIGDIRYFNGGLVDLTELPKSTPVMMMIEKSRSMHYIEKKELKKFSSMENNEYAYKAVGSLIRSIKSLGIEIKCIIVPYAVYRDSMNSIRKNWMSPQKAFVSVFKANAQKYRALWEASHNAKVRDNLDFLQAESFREECKGALNEGSIFLEAIEAYESCAGTGSENSYIIDNLQNQFISLTSKKEFEDLAGSTNWEAKNWEKEVYREYPLLSTLVSDRWSIRSQGIRNNERVGGVPVPEAVLEYVYALDLKRSENISYIKEEQGA